MIVASRDTLANGPAASDASVASDPWPTLPARAPDARTETQVADLLAHMSLEEKVGQMIQADIDFITPAQLAHYKLGAILAGGGAAPRANVRTGPSAWRELATSMRSALAGSDWQGRPIPLLFGIDAVHGDAKVIGATIFPHNVGLGATHDPALIRSIGEATAQEIASTGLDWTFAPTVAIARDVRWGRSYESYSEDPQLVAADAAAMLEGVQGSLTPGVTLQPGHVLATVKHFIGDGATLHGRDQGNAVTSEEDLARIQAAGYVAAIQAGAQIVMTSYSSWHGVKSSANRHLLTDVLKARFGFDGFVVSDWNAHEQVAGCTKFDCPAAILAGVDMLMAPDSWRQLYENTLAEVRSGVISHARIDDAVTRILRVKLRAGYFDESASARQVDPAVFGDAQHRALAREAVRRSLVLLKNERGLLPLRASLHVLVTGSAADDIGAQTGGWTVDWQGDHNRNADFPGATSIYAGIAARVRQGGGTVEYAVDGHIDHRPDVAIVVFGEGPYAEFEGDRETLQFSSADSQPLSMLRHLRKLGVPVVSVFLSGRPLWVNPELNASDAFVAAWLPGSEGEGIADVLFRPADGSPAYDFTGRLSFAWPSTVMPVQRSDGQDSGVLFAAGYGLHYPSSVSQTSVPPVPELPSVPGGSRVADSLFRDGHVTAPWSIYLSDALAEVRLTTALQVSPSGHLVAALQDSLLSAMWSAGLPSRLRIAGRAADWNARASQGLGVEVRFRVTQSPSSTVFAGLQCEPGYQRLPLDQAAPQRVATAQDASLCGMARGARLDVTDAIKAVPDHQWGSLELPLACFSRRGADLSNVQAPLTLETSGQLGLIITEVLLRPMKSAECDGPQLLRAHHDGKPRLSAALH